MVQQMESSVRANGKTNGLIRVGTLEELAAKEHVVVSGEDRPIVVFYNDGDVCAVDNRCPHMGFPLHKGGCRDGLIMCPWHHARFEAHSGCTFDLFAGDVEPFDVTVEDSEVFVASRPRSRDIAAHARRRLREGMDSNNTLVISKALLSLRSAGVEPGEIVREAALFGASHRDDWSGGMTALAALANLFPYLSEETAYIALYQGVRRVAADCAGQTSRRERYPLETDEVSSEQLDQWFSSWIKVRHRDAAERTLLTAIANDTGREELLTLIGNGATERVYADGGHIVDFFNKAFEILDLTGWEHAAALLPTHVARTAVARGAEEMNNWRQPLDLIPPLQQFSEALPALFAGAEGLDWQGEAELAEQALVDDPLAVLEAYRAAIAAGATPVQLAKATAYAAAVRVAHFSASNEIGDWFTALHTFSYCHAMHGLLKRCPEPRLVRGVLHGALSIYQDRFLNVPPLRVPKAGQSFSGDAAELRQLFLDLLDQRTSADEPARVVAHYLDLGHPVEPLIDTLTYAVAREDADFHTIQMVEAAVQEYFEWPGTQQGRTIMVAAARYLAAFSPTQRSQLQTARIAWRLHRGEKLYEDESESDEGDKTV